jgi:hypothetical protein
MRVDPIHPPTSVDLARHSLRQLTEAQRLTLMSEVLNQVSDPASRLQLTRITRLALAVSGDLETAAFTQRETRK